MKKTKFAAWGMLFMLITAVSASADDYGVTDYGTTGIVNTSIVTNITQVTLNPYWDWVPCHVNNPWSPDGQWIVYTARVGSDGGNDYNEICKMKADGTGWVRLTSNTECDSHASFTPNGQKIVFQRYPDAIGYAQIFIMNADGTGQTNLTALHTWPAEHCTGESEPVVSPDGTKIAFRHCWDRSAREGNMSIYVMNIDGSNPVKVSGSAVCCLRPSWSPDSKWIVFDSAGSRNDIKEVDYESKIYKASVTNVGEAVRLSPSTVSEAGSDGIDFCENWPIWSPDGEWIAFHQRYEVEVSGNDVYSLYIMRPDGSGRKLIAQEEQDSTDYDTVCAPTSWNASTSPSRFIAFQKYYNSTSNEHQFIADIVSGNTIQITSDYSDRRPLWSPDGSHILIKENGSPTRDGDTLNNDFLVMTINTQALAAASTNTGATGESNNCFISTLME